ncbi:MATE family efflux transporter [Algihabitans albus]|uniref:MATE family efflux transporter n=1 Tax=Algihabitans albus TaxID=2164067 RepID=UPI001ABC0F08|nr:MATE family efflux transporter [Algihabitans albus]
MSLAVPIVVGLAAATLIGVVDTIMIAPLGTQALAAAALATSALVILYSALYGLVSVIGITMAQARGAQEPKAVSSAVRNGALLGLIAGAAGTGMMIALFPLLPYLGQPEQVLAVLFPYWVSMAFVVIPFAILYVFKGLFDAVDRPWTGAAFALLGVLVNIPFNWVLIHGVFGWAGLGLLGAGLASLLAEGVALLAVWLYWRRSRSMAPFRQRAALSLKTMAQQFREGWPVALAYTGEGGAYALAGLMLGWFGAAALAANQVVGSIATVLYMLPLGMAAAVGIRIGQAVGAGETERVRAIGLGAFGAVVAWMAVVTVLLTILRTDISRALSDDPEVVAIASAMFLTMALMQVVDGIQSTSLGALRGLVDNRVPTVISLIAYWLIALPCAYLFGFWLDLGPAGVWIGYGLGLTTAAVALQVRFFRRTAIEAGATI